jgi:16S rRNA (uracil1498-N3)-methyltransferase
VHRFFAPALDSGDESVPLPRDEAEHLTRVLRLGVGDTVSVFDGRGREFVARVTVASRRDVRVAVLQRIRAAAELPVLLTLVQAVLKGERMDDVVRDATMLGAAAIQPVVTKRTETTVASMLRGARVDRWRRVALASVKQSKRAVLPDVQLPLTFESYLDEPASALRLMFVEPSADAAVEPLTALRGVPPPSDAAIIVGPEGGWTDAELQQARDRRIRLVSLGHRTLRADAVPIVALGFLAFLWGED